MLFFVFNLIGFDGEKKDEKKKQKLAEKYKKWLNEEVIYIISQNEKEVFKSLRTDEERENFIKAFWRRRDPTPEIPFNEFREEHYRRIEHANKNFFEGRTGWRTDRGRVYIMFGPPDFIDTNPGGARGFLFTNASTAEFPSEVWVYRSIPGLKARIRRVELTFINYYNSGSYQLTSNPALANALRNISIPARYAGYDDYIAPDSNAPDRDAVAQSRMDQRMTMNPLEQLSLMAELTKSRGEVLEELERTTRLRKLKGIVDAKASLVQLSFIAKENFLMGDKDLTYVPISMEVVARDLGFKKIKDRYRGIVNFYIEVKDKKGVVYQASDRLEMKLIEETYQRRFTDSYQYKHGLKLRPGEYFVHLVVWDEFNNNVGYMDRKIEVPNFSKKEFGISGVILARDIRVIEIKEDETVLESKDFPALKALKGTELKIPEKVVIKQKQGGPFTFGNLEINPNTFSEYKTNDSLVFFYQVYNPTYDDAQKMAKLLIEHQVWRNEKLFAVIGQPQEIHIPVEQKVEALNSVEKYSLSRFYPGKYTLLIRVKDIFSGKIVEKKVNFRMR